MKYMAFIISLLYITTINASDDSSGVNIQKNDEKGTLRILSQPVGAKIIINGLVIGVTPLKIMNVDTGKLRVKLALPGYESIEDSVILNAGETVAIEKKMTGIYADLSLSTIPPGATLYINNRSCGTTPFHSSNMSPGSYRLRLELPGYESMEGNVTLKNGESRTVEKKMIGAYGKLSVSTTPPGATVFFNDKQSGITPYSDEKMKCGIYSLKLKLPGYADITPENITINKETPTNLQYTFSRSKAWIDSVDVARHKHCRLVRRILFGSLAAATACAGWYFDSQVSDEVKKQNKIQSEYDKATSGFGDLAKRYDDAGNKAHDYAITRNILYSLSGIFAIGFVVSIPF
jgi:hypothetical protein